MQQKNRNFQNFKLAPAGRIGNLCPLEHQSRSKNCIETASTLTP